MITEALSRAYLNIFFSFQVVNIINDLDSYQYVIALVTENRCRNLLYFRLEGESQLL